MKNIHPYSGRLLTQDQLNEDEKNQALVLASQTEQRTCFRCGTPFSEDYRLPNGADYCRSCIVFGRVRSDEPLYAFPQATFPAQDSLIWQGQLSDWQKEVAQQLRKRVETRQATLVEAVTGAGKTEMVYPSVAAILAQGGAVCLASPRIDVCQELYQRLKRDFSCPISLLHGESDPYEPSPLVVATTHQLLKFYQAFDLLLIDEVDAFPYVDNAMLYHGARQALKKNGVCVYLTATSTKLLEEQVRKGELSRLCLPRRFHGHPLVVPEEKWYSNFPALLAKRRLPLPLVEAIRQQRRTGFPLLIFAPEIQMGQAFVQALQEEFSDQKVGAVSSQSDNRSQLVEDFRKKELDILVATTILERGVTFPAVDVFVLEAHHGLYTASSLIQIAGRVGRSLERPTGQVVFFHQGSTKAMKQAIRAIKRMNQEADYDPLSTL